MVEKSGLKLCVEKSCNLFKADPKYHGEHNFYIHGIHVIKVNHQPFLSENTHTQKKETFSYQELFQNTFQIIYRVLIIFENSIKIKKKRHAFFLKKNLSVFSSTIPKIIAYWSANSKKSPKNANVRLGISNNKDWKFVLIKETNAWKLNC